MQRKTIEELQKEYDLELNKIISKIKKIKKENKIILLQFPDGLKPYATIIADCLENKINNLTCLIWLDSCFGACDMPIQVKEIKPRIDLIIQFGHSELMPNYL